MHTVARLVALAGCLVASSSALYLPGVRQQILNEGDSVVVRANALTSTTTHLGHKYYDLPFCQPSGGINTKQESLGEILEGDAIVDSAYTVEMKVDKTCQVLCDPRTLSEEDIQQFVEKIDGEYHVHLIADNLPAAVVGLSADGLPLYAQGFPVGGQDLATQEYFLFNHLQFRVKWHEADAGASVVGLEVYPMSIAHDLHPASLPQKPEGGLDLAAIALPGCDAATGYDFATANSGGYSPQLVYGDRAARTVVLAFSYDVFWDRSDVKWTSRWDIYLSNGYRASPSIHWWSILNSLAIVALLTGMVALILVRALYRDISRYNRVATDEERAEDREETGWKLVHGDVFRPPTRNPVLFAVTIGTGTQLLLMLAGTVFFSAVGFLSPAHRGSLMGALVVIFMLLGAVGGYVAARVHKMFDGKAWQRTTLWTAFLIPGVLFAVLFTLNLFVWSENSVNAIPFLSMLAVLALWLAVSVPLVFAGAFLGFRQEAPTLPKKVRGVPRRVPPQPWYLSDLATAALGGLLPFGTMYVELLFIMTSIWHDQYYYVYGFLLLVALLTVVAAAEISMVLVYFTLVAEDYNWWWKSFRIPASAGAYLFLYSIYYYAVHLNLTGAVPALLYFGYMGIISAGVGLALGVVGYHSTLEFVRRIYDAVRTD